MFTFFELLLKKFSLYTVKVFLSNINSFRTVTWFQVFLFDTNNLIIGIWFQVTNNNPSSN